MSQERSSRPVVVVGGGLAGLLSALSLARRGRRVLVLERGATPGGRARSAVRDGFVWNQGPHAVYRAGVFAKTLRELGIPVAGRRNRIRGSYAVVDDGAHALPTNPLALVTTTALTPRERFAFGRFYFHVGSVEASRFADVSLSDYLATHLPEGRARQLAEALFRLSTYGGDAARMSAECGLRQMQLSSAGVDYVDGGWQSIVDSLVAALEERGVTIRAHAHAVAIEDEAPLAVRLADGERIPAAAVVATGAPDEAAALVEGKREGPLHRFAKDAAPVRAACLDLALARVPSPGRTFALGLDRPTYASLHSATARLAPDGGGVLHAAVYLGDQVWDPSETRALCETLVDTLQPGFREVTADSRFLPRMTVHHALVTASMGGFRGRPSVSVARRPGVFVAGDWVGPRGLLADASAASASVAAESILASSMGSSLPSSDAA